MTPFAIRRIALTLACALAAQGTATSVLERSLAEIFTRADVIVYGEVITVEPDVVDDQIRTRVEIEVARDLGGRGDGDGDGDDASGDVRTLTFLAGQTSSGRTTVVDDLPTVARGDRVLVAWYRDEGLVSPVVGVWQGLWRLAEGGLVDDSGRALGVDDGLITLGGVERDVSSVLDAIETALGDGDGDGRGEGVRLDDSVRASDRDAAQAVAPDADPTEPTDAADTGDAADATTADSPATDAPPTDPSPTDAEADADAGPPIELRLEVPDDAALRPALEAAVRAWNDVGVPLRLVTDDEAENRVTIGSLAAFGSDALAYSRRVDGLDGVELLLRPGPEGRRVDVLARELGRWVGLPDADRARRDPAEPAIGLRSGTFPPDDQLRPGTDDAAALLAARSGLPEDLNGDGVVDLYDLALVAEAYGTVGTRLQADLDGSGRVDDADLERLEQAYEFLPPARDAPPDRRSTRD